MLANFLSESDMMEWAGTTIACTGDFMAGAYVDTPSQKPFSNREVHSPLATHTAAFLHALVLLAAGFALCYRESINLT